MTECVQEGGCPKISHCFCAKVIISWEQQKVTQKAVRWPCGVS